MANKNNQTIFQRLTDVIIGTGRGASSGHAVQNLVQTPVYNMNRGDDVLFTFDNKEQRDQKLAELRQQKLLSYQWLKTGLDTTMQQMVGATHVKVMYRDLDLMDQFPEISKAFDIYSEEATSIRKGKMLNINSKSERIKSILEDLFVNRLDIHMRLPSIAREVCKYGNNFMLMNIEAENGVMGWQQLPVYEMRRLENGLQNIYGAGTVSAMPYPVKPDEVKFVWEGHNEEAPFRNWQVAHFRSTKNTVFLPYGVSFGNSARRAWRMLSMMEDAMMLYRLEKSIERRIFKVNVGGIDDADITAFMNQFKDNIKSAPIIDPETGQIDLRRNFLDVSQDYFIPVRPGGDPSSIETLQGANNITIMDDIKYMQSKVLTALGVPKSFLNFTDATNKTANLSILDVRFSRSVNYLQQVLLMELNKIAIIHLYCLGFVDDITNFTLSLNNPSNEVELMEIDTLTKRLTAASTALANTDAGLQLMSWHQVQKEIMGKTDYEIATMLNEMRVEAALANELKNTTQIIKKTGIFDKSDRIYGEPGAQYSNTGGEGEEGGGMFGGGGGGGSIGGGLPPIGDSDFNEGDFGDEGLGGLGEPGEETEGEVGGETGTADMGGQEPLQETSKFDEYINTILNTEDDDVTIERPKSTSDKMFINEDMDSAIKQLDKLVKRVDENNKKRDKQAI